MKLSPAITIKQCGPMRLKWVRNVTQQLRSAQADKNLLKKT